jgi:hypothetical protein
MQGRGVRGDVHRLGERFTAKIAKGAKVVVEVKLQER